MIADDMAEQFTRRFELELVPPSRWDAAQAVLYRNGETLDLVRVEGWSDACREALTERLIPQLRSRRRRWLSAVYLEDPIDVDRSPHERPALVAAAGLSCVLPGGLLLERLSDLGSDPVHRAVVITWLAEHAGMSGVRGVDDVPLDIADSPVGTFTAGDLRQRAKGRRFGGSARTDRSVQEHVRKLNQEAFAAVVRTPQDASRYGQLYERFSAVVSESRDNGLRNNSYEIRVAKHAMSSQLFSDLGYPAARDLAQAMHSQGVHPDRAWQTLQLAGFLNEAGNRLWNRELVERAGGWSV